MFLPEIISLSIFKDPGFKSPFSVSNALPTFVCLNPGVLILECIACKLSNINCLALVAAAFSPAGKLYSL